MSMVTMRLPRPPVEVPVALVPGRPGAVVVDRVAVLAASVPVRRLASRTAYLVARAMMQTGMFGLLTAVLAADRLP